MMKTRFPYRLRLSYPNNQHATTYIVRDDKHRIAVFNGMEKPVELSELFGKGAAELRFRLEDAIDYIGAMKVINDHANTNMVERQRPVVENLS